MFYKILPIVFFSFFLIIFQIFPSFFFFSFLLQRIRKCGYQNLTMEKILISGYLTCGDQIQFFLLGWGNNDKQGQSYWFFPISTKLHMVNKSSDIQQIMDFVIVLIKNNIELLKLDSSNSTEQTFPPTQGIVTTFNSSTIDWESLTDLEPPFRNHNSFSYDTPKEIEETRFDSFSDETPRDGGTIVSKQYYLKKGKEKNLLHEHTILQKLKGLLFFPQGMNEKQDLLETSLLYPLSLFNPFSFFSF